MRPCWPKMPSSVVPSSSAGNSDIIAKYVSTPAKSVIWCARKSENARLRTAGNDARPASPPPGASGTAGLEPAATPPAIAVAAAADPGDEHEDRGDDADDRGQAQHQAQPVDERCDQDGEQDSDHGRPFGGRFPGCPHARAWPFASPVPGRLIPPPGQQRVALGHR